MVLLYDDFGSHDKKAQDDARVEIFLDPGEYFVGDATFRIRTVLGSCVSIVLWHQRMQYGAMSHFLLPTRKINTENRKKALQDNQQDFPPASPLPLDGKYVDEGLELILWQLRDAKIPLHECVAKIFGGGNMFSDLMIFENLNVGKINGEAAKRLLREKKIRIVAEDLFSVGHREVIFNVSNGEVWVRQGSLPSH